MKHTPGPWKLTMGSYWLRIVGPRGQAIASFGNQRRWMNQHEVEANALLIAAAPELLEACEALKAWYEDDEAAPFDAPMSLIDAAIAKAKGE